MDFKVIILISIAFLNLALGLAIFFQSKKSVISFWFFLFSVGTALWSFGMMFYATLSNSDSILFWALILHFAGAFIAHSFFFFSLAYPRGKMPIGRLVQILFYIPVLLIFYFMFIDQKIIVGLNMLPNNRQLLYGVWYPFYFGYFFIFMLGGIVLMLIRSVKETRVKLKRQIRIVALAILAPLVFTGFINMFLAALGDFQFAWVGPIFLLFVLLFIAYAIMKLNFLDVKVIATEIFAIFLSLVTFVEIFSSDSIGEMVVRIIIFLITLVFAVSLIRSVLREVKRREQMEELAKKLKKTSKELKLANKELKRLDEAKSEFLSIASHQLRTPLTVVKGYTSMMLEGSFGKVPKLIKQNMEKVYIATERLISLVESLLNISRIESGRLEFNMTKVDLSMVTKSLVDDFQQKAKAKDIKLEFYADKNLPKVNADEGKVKEIISNLLDNAVKYTDNGSISVNIHPEGTSLVFSCQDTGMGIEPQDLPRLFEKFVRGNGMMQVHTEGTGLGLYFARMVVENMGGRIWAESPGKNKGSKFSFSLPLADKSQAKKVG